ncbi:MAG: Nif3-like dinuclear metal center hexameric protein [Candidatus Thorarchaeota archaeon]|nr:Nif3-like dinuclear metal center hexameric protein [Candidatus Thorarchaeota archaeon]
MMTTLRELIKYLRGIAPREYTVGGFENRVEIGPQTETEQGKTTIKRILVATYPSSKVVTKASQDKANLLITHRPLFQWAVDRIGGNDLLRLRILAKNYISTYIMGSSWIAAKNGLSDALVETLGLRDQGEFYVSGDYTTRVPLGRICKTNEKMIHSKFANYIVGKLAQDRLIFTGDLDAVVEDVLVTPGTLLDMPEILEAKRNDIFTIVTGELTPDIRILAHEEGINVFEVGAFVTEEPGMRRLRNYLALEYPELKIEFVPTEPVTKILKHYGESLS